MLISEQIKHFKSLDAWFTSALGILAAREFCSELRSISEFPKGENLLQLGHCGNSNWLKFMQFQNKWIASPFPVAHQEGLVCAFNQLPFTRNSLDCIVAPLTLEPFGNRLSLLDEIDRVLKPMGHIVLMSINPWSLWGLAMQCKLLGCYASARVTMRTPMHLNRIFVQRGYKPFFLGHFCYIPPINKESLLSKLTFLDEVGKMLWPFPSGLYCYIAQKYDYIPSSPIVKSAEKMKLADFETSLQPTASRL